MSKLFELPHNKLELMSLFHDRMVINHVEDVVLLHHIQLAPSVRGRELVFKRLPKFSSTFVVYVNITQLVRDNAKDASDENCCSRVNSCTSFSDSRGSAGGLLTKENMPIAESHS